MSLHRPLALIFTALMLQACSQEAPPPAGDPQAASAADTAVETTSVYEWHARGYRAGETTIVRAGDGRVTTEAFVHWNNREYRLKSELQLDADGMVVAQKITGTSPATGSEGERPR